MDFILTNKANGTRFKVAKKEANVMTDMSIKRLKPEDKDKFYRDKMGLFVKVAPQGERPLCTVRSGGKAVRKR